MIDEDKYWEQFIAVGVLVLALYPFTKDFLNEPIFNHAREKTAQLFAGSMFAPLITLTIVAYFLAIFTSLLILWTGRMILSSKKKKEKINNYNSFWH